MNAETTQTDALAILRKPFPAENIAKLPKVNCRNCSQGNGTCQQHQKRVTCKECGNWLTPGHIHLDYVGHAETTDRLLDADPTWTWEPMAVTPQGLPQFDEHGGLWIRLTIAGVTRIGYGAAGPNKRGPDAIKEVIGDAIRNGSMRFGVALDLWAKTDLHADEQPPAPAEPDQQHAAAAPPSDQEPMSTPAQIDRINELLMLKRGLVPSAGGQLVMSIVRRELQHPRALTFAEAQHVIDVLSVEPNLASPAAEAPAAQAQPRPEPTRFATPEQLTKIAVVFAENGVHNREERLRAICTTIGRQIDTTKQLTVPEASLVIETYQRKNGGDSEASILHTLVESARTPEDFEQARADIEREHQARNISDAELGKLREHWTQRRAAMQQAAQGVAA